MKTFNGLPIEWSTQRDLARRTSLCRAGGCAGEALLSRQDQYDLDFPDLFGEQKLDS
ncbi:MAG TPA: hypothetical protein VI320_26265 [Terracidiphilus sp.]